MTIDKNQYTAFHILPYKIVSDEYGDYPYKGEYEDEDGELVSETIEGLWLQIDALFAKYIAGWADGPLARSRSQRSNLSTQYLSSLKDYIGRFPRRSWLSFREQIENTPCNGLKYPVFGDYRIELREFPDRSLEMEFDAKLEKHIIEQIPLYIAAAADVVKKKLAIRLVREKERDLAHKRQQLEQLKKELGKS